MTQLSRGDTLSFTIRVDLTWNRETPVRWEPDLDADEIAERMSWSLRDFVAATTESERDGWRLPSGYAVNIEPLEPKG